MPRQPPAEGDRGPRFVEPGVDVAPTAWIAPGAVVVGRVTLGERASVWYGCVLRGDLEPIHVGDDTNVQDLSVIHVDHGMAARIGRRVTIGHRALIHGCTIEDDVLVGMGAVLLSGCRIGGGSVIAAGSLIQEGFEVPPGTLVAGVPARVRGPVGQELNRRIADGADSYVATAERYRRGELGGGRFGGAR